jgi:hypothetical protein
VWTVESIVTRRTRFVHLLPVLVFLVLRAMAHAHPTPLPWTSGVFDGNGLDDVLQTIRASYSGASDVGHVRSDVRGIPTGRISVSEPSLVARFLLSGLHSRAPPLS